MIGNVFGDIDEVEMWIVEVDIVLFVLFIEEIVVGFDGNVVNGRVCIYLVWILKLYLGFGVCFWYVFDSNFVYVV